MTTDRARHLVITGVTLACPCCVEHGATAEDFRVPKQHRSYAVRAAGRQRAAERRASKAEREAARARALAEDAARKRARIAGPTKKRARVTCYCGELLVKGRCAACDAIERKVARWQSEVTA